MKTVFRLALLGLTLVAFNSIALAAGDKDKGDRSNNKNSGGNAGAQSNPVQKLDQQKNNSTNNDGSQKQSGQNDNGANLNKQKDNNPKDNDNSIMKNPSKNSGGNIKNDRKGNIGDKDFDKNGIGKLDEKKFSDQKDNKWRYSKKGSQWWYWGPSGYWMYWHGGNWVRYDADTYVDATGGPYYEDDNGFFSLQSGRKVYDPQIRRVGAPR